jgi:hypothetical protein
MWPFDPPTDQEIASARQKAALEESQKSSHEGNDARIQEGDPALGLEGRPEGQGPWPGDSYRPQSEWSEYEKEVRRQAQQAVERDLLNAPYKVRIQFWDNTTCDVACVIPWRDWLENIRAYRGMAFDKGFIPVQSIKLIVHVDALGNPLQPGLGENVVPFKRPPA